MSDLTINLHLAAMLLLLLLGRERFPCPVTGQTPSGEAVPGTAVGCCWTPEMGIGARHKGGLCGIPSTLPILAASSTLAADSRGHSSSLGVLMGLGVQGRAGHSLVCPEESMGWGKQVQFKREQDCTSPGPGQSWGEQMRGPC